MSISFSQLELGQTYASQGRTLTDADIHTFAGLSGDFNPLHTDDVWVKENTDYNGRIAHGLLILSMGSGMRTPVIDDLHILGFLEVTRKMLAPVYPGDTITVTQTIAGLRESRSRPGTGIVTIEVETRTHSETIVQSGTDTLLVGDGA